MKVSDERADTLFAGKPVVLRRDADKATAVRFEKAFGDAGARLQIMPVEVPAATEDDEFVLAEPGALLGNVDRPVPPAPDTSHISLAELGADLADAAPEPRPVVSEVSWDLAEPGTPLGVESGVVDPAIDVETVDFEVEAPGVRLDRRRKKLPPDPPDTSHLEVESLD